MFRSFEEENLEDGDGSSGNASTTRLPDDPRKPKKRDHHTSRGQT